MAGYIFYRERHKVKDGSRLPRYCVVAASGVDLSFYAKHLRKSELEHIAEVTKAELVLLKRGAKHR